MFPLDAQQLRRVCFHLKIVRNQVHNRSLLHASPPRFKNNQETFLKESREQHYLLVRLTWIAHIFSFIIRQRQKSVGQARCTRSHQSVLTPPWQPAVRPQPSCSTHGPLGVGMVLPLTEHTQLKQWLFKRVK